MAPGCKGADKPSAIMSSFFKGAKAGCCFLKSSKFSKTALTTRYTNSSSIALLVTTVALTPKVVTSFFWPVYVPFGMIAWA